MNTTMITFEPNGSNVSQDQDLPTDPGYDRLKAVLDPLFPGGFEHVTVLHKGERRDMFVGETSSLDGLPRNEVATAIYRNNWLTQHPRADPESIPAIYGRAVLFDRRVWF